MTSCPHCGEPAEPGQLVCLECGTRIALKEEGGERRSPPSSLRAIRLPHSRQTS